MKGYDPSRAQQDLRRSIRPRPTTPDHARPRPTTPWSWSTISHRACSAHSSSQS